jgi:hypothetical protein
MHANELVGDGLKGGLSGRRVSQLGQDKVLNAPNQSARLVALAQEVKGNRFKLR